MRITAHPAAALAYACLLGSAGGGAPVRAQESPRSITLTPAELFTFADSARDRGDFATADAAYRALADNPDMATRNEARFRLALMLSDRQQRYRDAAVLLRQILDEQPHISRVRVELARMQASLGEFDAARRELRAAQAAGLPPEVQQVVRFYASALEAHKRLGGSVQVALAPDSNINRATQSDTLETVFGDFDLAEDAQETSGVGLSLRGQAFVRQPLAQRTDLLLRANVASRIYARKQFNDHIVSAQVGPQWTKDDERLSLSVLVSRRWYDNKPYNLAWGMSGNWQHPLSPTARLTVDTSAVRSKDHLNTARTASRYSVAVGMDKAFSARLGGGITLAGLREVARDPGYSMVTAGINGYVFRELGQTTLVLNLGYDHLEADQRLFFYPRRRIDNRFELGITGTFRAFRLGSLAPLASARLERNRSSIAIYDYRRAVVELGVTAAF